MKILSLLGFQKKIEEIRGEQTVPRLVEWIDAKRIVNDPKQDLIDGKPFVPGDCYFELRLAGLHLKDSRRLAQQLLPLCVCLAEFRQSGSQQTVPFSLGPDTIRQRLQQLPKGADGADQPHSRWVELRDIEIVRPTPMSLDNLDAFIGLYAVPGDDIARTLLNVMGTIGQAFGGAISPALAVAEKVYDGFTTLLGVKGVTPEVEAMHGDLLKESGYLLISNAPENSPFKGKLFVSGGRLREGDKADSALVTGFDYCLLAVQRRDTLIDASNTAPDLFGGLWASVIKAFEESDAAAAAAFKRLQRTIYGSGDLIARDRDALVAGYLVEYRKAIAVLGTAKDDGIVLRGPGRNELLAAVEPISSFFQLLAEDPASEISDTDRKQLTSGAGAWQQAASFRSQFEQQPAGSVADLVIRAMR
ncbi:hypothetical protein [Bradyrhizobium sp. MOS003]|jgi:hypothetical protein|uniref:hypothetical protein n=1 Tax=Bradyrhizobium sp. MOS003 TaxID=2133946 RepID=UPI0011BF2733|nr:hypothetical protein [Bradyrhizobium sp. MOS003]